MKFCFSVLLAALFLMAVPSHAQMGIYINPVGVRVSNSQSDTGPFAFLGDGQSSRMFWGANIGFYDDFFHGKSIDAGIDLRDMVVGGNNARLNSFLVGVRVVPKNLLPDSWRPYVQVSGGAGTTRAPHSAIHVSRGQYGVFAGADYKLNRYIDVKAFEIGYGALSTVNSTTYGSVGGDSYPSSRTLSFSGGLVFRIR
ncbi:MAG TPA: hypothetical protein VGB69_07520 [Edaphobacter sp.]